MRTVSHYILCVQLGVVALATAQGTPSTGGVGVSSAGLPSREAPKPIAVKSVSFDPKSKLNTAYAKILSTAEQTFEDRLQTAMVMERWEDVANLMTEVDAAQRRVVALKTLDEATQKVSIPMIWVFKILESSEGELTSAEYKKLVGVIKKTLGSFGGKDLLIRNVSKGVLGVGGDSHEGRKAAYNFFLELGLYDEATKYLTTTAEAKKAKDYRVILQHFAALKAKCNDGGRTDDYIRLRELGNWLLIENKLSARDRKTVEETLLPSLGFIDEDDAVEWFAERFKKGPSVEKETVLLCTAYLQKNQSSKKPTLRNASLRLQQRMLTALIRVTGLKDRGPVVDILADYWLQEAKRGERRVKEETQHNQRYQWHIRSGREVPPVKLSDVGAPSMETLRETAPSSECVAKLSPDNFLKLQEYRGDIFINTGDYTQALAVVEDLAKLAPKKGESLAEKLLRTWGNNANPNAGVSQNSSYAGRKGIPLTRTKQLRNLKQLKEIVGKLREVLGADLNETILVRAFTRAHSNAEVYKLEDIHEVLGKPETLSKDAVWALTSRMQDQLAKSWREEDLQKAMATKRTKKELEDQVDQGYTTLSAFIEQAIKGQEYPTRLHALHGVVLFQYFEFKYKLDRQEEDKLKKCFAIRDKAYDCFNEAVKSYGAFLTRYPDAEYSVEIFNLWFDTILNASSTNTVDGKAGLGTDNLDAIGNAVKSLPEATVSEHRERLAKALLDKALKAPPERKIALLESGLHLSGGTAQEEEYKRHLDYYQELLLEVKMLAKVDGEKNVGTKPFGLYLSLLHTPELARESGGFGQYLAPEMRNPFNPRAPTFKPAEKFMDNIHASFSKNFEIVSITLSPRSVTPVDFDVTQWTGDELMAGKWQETPLAYVVLKAKEEAVDDIPPTHIDLHFVDLNSGVSIPVRSRVIHGIKAGTPAPRPCPNLQITQMLDQRDLNKDGKVTLEIIASGNGVIPELADMLEIPELAAFDSTVADDGLQVKAIEVGTKALPNVERSWTVTYKLDKKRTEVLPKKFVFPQPKMADAQLVNKVYDDANLEEVESDVALSWGEKKPFDYVLFAVIAGVIIALIAGVVIASRMKPALELADADTYSMPETITPFAVVHLLQMLCDDKRLTEADKESIRKEVATLEADFFSENASGEADKSRLESIARTWLAKVK